MTTDYESSTFRFSLMILERSPFLPSDWTGKPFPHFDEARANPLLHAFDSVHTFGDYGNSFGRPVLWSACVNRGHDVDLHGMASALASRNRDQL